SGGSGVLPNGRVVTPMGRSVEVETLPLNLRLGVGGQLFVTNDGNGDEDFERYLQFIDPQTLQVRRTQTRSSVFGLALSPDGQRVYVANGPRDRIDVYAFDGTSLSKIDGASISFPGKTFPMGLELSADGQTLYATGLLSNTFWEIDVASATKQVANKPV